MANRAEEQPAEVQLGDSTLSGVESSVHRRVEVAPIAPRKERLEQKSAEVRRLLGQLDPGDPRGRLFKLAMLRRDELVIDGLLAELGGAESGGQADTQIRRQEADRGPREP